MKTRLLGMHAGFRFFVSPVGEYGLNVDFPLTLPLWLAVFVTLICSSFVPTTGRAQVNTWTNLLSGLAFKWEDGVNWSLGTPSPSNQSVFVTNAASASPNFRVRNVNIDATTAGSFTFSMNVNNLTVSAPIIGSFSSFNTLVVSNSTSTPLQILNTCTISTRGTIFVSNSVIAIKGSSPFTNLVDEGTLVIDTGSLITSNGVEAVIGRAGTGMLTVLDGTWVGYSASLGALSGGLGTLTIAGGTSTLQALFEIGAAPSATGAVWLTGGLLITTNNAAVGESGSGQMTVSNGTWQSFAGIVGYMPGSQGTLTVAGGTNSFSSFLDVGLSPAATGTVWLTGGVLTLANGVALVGSSGIGQMTVSNGTWRALGVTVGANAGSQGTLTVAGGNNTVSTSLDIAEGANAAGSVWLTGGQLILTNVATSATIGDSGVGQMTVSNGTWSAYSAFVGSIGGQGTLTIAGGTNMIKSRFDIARAGATGAVWLKGGLLTATNDVTYVGSFGVGRMTVSNGTWQSQNIVLAFAAGSQGTLTIAGGTSIATNLIIGGFPCASTGMLNIVGGELDVTNGAGNAVLEVRTGTFTLSGGTVRVDKFVMTNSCASFLHTGGTLIYGTAVLDPNRDDDGDGIPNGYEQAHGLDPLNPADANVDSDGDGLSNLQEFLAGTDPANSASYLHITSIVNTGNDILVTWNMGPGKTNALQRTTGVGDGSYQTNGFTSIFIVTNTVGTTTNYLDVGGATNAPARYYRVRLVP